MLLRALLALPVSALVAGCSSSASTASRSSEPPTSSTPSSAACAEPPAGSAFTWPSGVPSDLPHPAGARVDTHRPVAGTSGKPGVVVSVTVPTGLKANVAFVRSRFAAAGVRLGRGDAEEDEADLPLSRSDFTGQLRLRAQGECETEWILTVLPR